MKRHFTQKQQEEIYQRDRYCQICGACENLDKPHHIFYGTHRINNFEKNYNGIWNGAMLCADDHRGFHHTGKFKNGENLKYNRDLLEDKAQKQYENT